MVSGTFVLYHYIQYCSIIGLTLALWKGISNAPAAPSPCEIATDNATAIRRTINPVHRRVSYLGCGSAAGKNMHSANVPKSKQPPFVQDACTYYESTFVPRPLLFLIMLRWPYSGAPICGTVALRIPFAIRSPPTARLGTDAGSRMYWYHKVHQDDSRLTSRLDRASLQAISSRPENGADGLHLGRSTTAQHAV